MVQVHSTQLQDLAFFKGYYNPILCHGPRAQEDLWLLLGLIVDLLVPGGLDLLCVVKAACALLDFLFLAQFQCYTSNIYS